MSKDDPARAARLAEALRVNLRRRKAQARAVVAEAGPQPDGRTLPDTVRAPPPERSGT